MKWWHNLEHAQWGSYSLIPPATARDVLHVNLWICAHIEEGSGSRYIAMLAQWCAAHVVDGDPDEIDALGLGEMLALKNAILDSASLPQRVLDAVHEFYRVLYSGGCECVTCKTPERVERLSEAQKERVAKSCRYVNVKPTDMTIADMAHGVEGSDPLDMPWWLYQLHNHRLSGINRGQADKIKEREDGRKAEALLREKGLWGSKSKR